MGYNRTKFDKHCIKYTNINNKICIQLKLNENIVYLIPGYSNFSCWNDDFEELVQIMEGNKKINAIILGVWNAHTGKLHICPTEIFKGTKLLSEVRNSKDNKIDERGRRVRNFGFTILNGRTYVRV